MFVSTTRIVVIRAAGMPSCQLRRLHGVELCLQRTIHRLRVIAVATPAVTCACEAGEGCTAAWSAWWAAAGCAARERVVRLPADTWAPSPCRVLGNWDAAPRKKQKIDYTISEIFQNFCGRQWQVRAGTGGQSRLVIIRQLQLVTVTGDNFAPVHSALGPNTGQTRTLRHYAPRHVACLIGDD